MAATRHEVSGTASVSAGESRREPTSVAHGSILFFASSVVGAGGFLVASLLLARLLGPSGRGTVAFMTVTALLTARVVKFGLGQATVVLAAQRPAARATLLANLLMFSLSASLAGVALVVGGLYLFDAEPAGFESGDLAILAAAIVAASLVDDNFLVGCGRLREAAAISASGGWLCATAVAAALLIGGLRVETAMLAWVAAHLVWAALLAGVGLRAAGPSLPSVRLLVESMRFGVRAWGGSVSQFLNARADQLLVGILATDVTLGLYVVAVNAAEVPDLPAECHRDVVAPGTGARYDAGRDPAHTSHVPVRVGADAREHRRHGSTRLAPDTGHLRPRLS